MKKHVSFISTAVLAALAINFSGCQALNDPMDQDETKNEVNMSTSSVILIDDVEASVNKYAENKTENFLNELKAFSEKKYDSIYDVAKDFMRKVYPLISDVELNSQCFSDVSKKLSYLSDVKNRFDKNVVINRATQESKEQMAAFMNDNKVTDFLSGLNSSLNKMHKELGTDGSKKRRVRSGMVTIYPDSKEVYDHLSPLLKDNNLMDTDQGAANVLQFVWNSIPTDKNYSYIKLTDEIAKSYFRFENSGYGLREDVRNTLYNTSLFGSAMYIALAKMEKRNGDAKDCYKTLLEAVEYFKTQGIEKEENKIICQVKDNEVEFVKEVEYVDYYKCLSSWATKWFQFNITDLPVRKKLFNLHMYGQTPKVPVKDFFNKEFYEAIGSWNDMSFKDELVMSGFKFTDLPAEGVNSEKVVFVVNQDDPFRFTCRYSIRGEWEEGNGEWDLNLTTYGNNGIEDTLLCNKLGLGHQKDQGTRDFFISKSKDSFNNTWRNYKFYNLVLAN